MEHSNATEAGESWPIIHIHDGVCRMPEWRMAQPVNFTSLNGEHIAIVGPNGGGKTRLVNIIIGRYPLLMRDPEYDFRPSQLPMVSDNIKYITFLDAYGGDNDRTYYLQQRWNRTEMDEATPTVGQKLEEAYHRTGDDTPERRALQQKLYDTFRLDQLVDKYTPLLSSGELRKFKLTETLLAAPRVLIMDNPFIGLDAATRDQLRELLATITRELDLQIMLVLSKSDDIPPFITHVVEVRDNVVLPKRTLNDYLDHRPTLPPHVLSADVAQGIIDLPYKDNEYHTREVVGMHDVSIRYGERTILKELSWTVLNGERWALVGKNGAGKSTLLSLVCADNPQSYACDIALFDNPRGSGESIWDIKKHIGYVSPEMHRAYKRDLPAIHIVASGLKDSVGLYVKPQVNEYDICRFWMNVFGIRELENRTFMKLSSGEQRLVLLARAFVKDPELLILDEPLHGLDNRNRQLVKNVIETFCQRKNKTLIMVTHYESEMPACIDHRIELVRH
ncbi:MAG: ATP-binding cassette domain-containing protein [Prevotella sp.]|nr:ATP-binding cassette domain-containing protein [Prevotella sp.]